MRVTFTAMYRQAADDLNRSAAALAARQAEVSSGKRLLAPSDDPIGAAALVRERGEIAALDQFVRSTETLSSRLTIVDSVLSDLVQRLTAAQTAALGARGTAVTALQREAFANELAGLRDAIVTDLNLRVGDAFVFSGSAFDLAPYERAADGTISAYRGNSTRVFLDLDRQWAVGISLDAEAITRGPDADDLFQEFQLLIDAARSGDEAGLARGIDALKRAFERTIGVQSGIGTDLTLIEGQRGRLMGQRTAAVARASGHEDANMVSAISAMSQAETAYRAALGAAGTLSRISLMDYLR